MRKTTIITDPIHHVMNLGSDPQLRNSVRTVIDTTAFQRLRRVTQLGLTSYVFPGATHTRFSHSLGVAYLAHSVLSHLMEWAESEEDRKAIRLVFNDVVMAALLHDIGHGPFSHSFEHVLEGYKWAPLHEDWTASLITGEKSEIRRALSACGIDANRIASVFAKNPTGNAALERPYREIVSSQIDVDRMDYLLRDSHSAGVAIGQFDAQYLIQSMVIVKHGNGQKSRTLGLTPKGIKAYEAFLLARQLMNRTVYYHHNVKVLEFMVEQIFRLVVQHLSKFAADSRVAPLIPLYLRRISKAIESGGKSKKDILEEARIDYIRLTEDVAWVLIAAVAESPVVPQAQALARGLLTRKILPHFTIEVGKKDLLSDTLQGDGFVANRDFHLLDVKTTMYKGSGDGRVFVLGWDGAIDEVSDHSETITAFRDRPEAESLLIVLDYAKLSRIQEAARMGQFLAPSRVSAHRKTPRGSQPGTSQRSIRGRR
jgi:uncharacterized protein